MSRPFTRIGTLGFFAAALLAAPVHAEVLQWDVREVFNADVVLNNGAGKGGFVEQGIDGDAGQSDLDGAGRVWMTQSAANAHKNGPEADKRQGLPDDGVFPASELHPEVRLALNNKDDGNNVWRAPTGAAPVTFKVPAKKYDAVHLYMTAGNAREADLMVRIKLDYAGGESSESEVAIKDWFSKIEQSPATYTLISGRDRFNLAGGVYEDSSLGSIFGFVIKPDPERELQSITLSRSEGKGVITFYGGLGVTK